MTTTPANHVVRSGEPTVTEARSAFSRRWAVTVDIGAPPAQVWALLTDAARFPRWNSTVTSIVGTIAAGERLAITVPISDRTFRPTVVEFVAPQRMRWADGQAPFFVGERTFTVEPAGVGTRFTMQEMFRGVTVPLAARSLPDFGPVFKAYAADLKAEAERPAGR